MLPKESFRGPTTKELFAMERTIPKLIGKEEWPSLEENMRVGAIFEARCDVEALAYAYAERDISTDPKSPILPSLPN